MRIDKELVKEMREEVLQAVRAVAARHGLDVSEQKSVRYTEESFGVKYTFSDADIDLAEQDFSVKCFQFGLSPKHYGAMFKHGAKTIIITGVSTRAPKYPIKYTADGNPMKCSALAMRNMLRDSGMM